MQAVWDRLTGLGTPFALFLVFTALMLVFQVVRGIMRARAEAARADWTRASGVVVDLVREPGTGTGERRIVEYTAADGRVLRSVPIAAPRAESFATGERLELAVDPADPLRIAVPGATGRIARRDLLRAGLTALAIVGSIAALMAIGGDGEQIGLLRSIIGVVATVVPLLFVVIGLATSIAFLRAARVPEGAVEATGTVVDVAIMHSSDSDGVGRTSRYPIYEFATRDGRRVIGQARVGTSGMGVDLGRTAELRYDPEDPRRFWARSATGSFFGALIGLVFVAVGIGVFLVMSPLSPFGLGR